MLDVRRLQTLRAVAREGSLSAAARATGYTQPAISHSISRLEAEVGTPLLTRLGRGVQLTDAGRALVEHADVVVSRLEAAEEELAAIAGLRAGRVRIAAFPSASATLLAGALARLRADHPKVAISFDEAEPEDALPLLRAGELDLVVAFSYPAVGERDGRDLVAEPLLTDPSLAVLPAGHRLAGGKRPLKLQDLDAETWIAGCVRCRRHLLHVAGEAGFEPQIEYATDDYMTVQSLVAAGLAVSLLPALALTAAQHPQVAARAVAGGPGRTVEVVLPAAERRPPAVTATIAALRGAATQLAATAPKVLGLRAV